MDDFKNEFLKGVSWTLIAQVITQAFSLIITIVLARLLSPVEFGLLAMVTVLTGFARILVDFGLGNALIFKREVTEADKSSVFWTNLLLSSIIAAGYILLSDVIAEFYNEHELKAITVALSSLLVINSLSIVNSAMLRKELDFKTIFKASFISQLVSSTIAIVLALRGYGYWALVAQSILNSIISTTLGFYFVRWFPSFRFSLSSLKMLLDFSWALVGNNSLNYWVRNLDNLLIGKFLGAADLSIYTKSYSTLTLPIRNVSSVISQVLFPSLSKLKDSPGRLKSVYFKVCKTITLIITPMMIFIFVEADILIGLVFGEKWIGMLPVVRVFSILAINQSVGTLISNLYMAHGKTKAMFYLGTAMRIMLMSSIVIGLMWGIVGVAVSYTIASFVSSFIQHTYIGRISGFTIKELIGNLANILILNIFIGGLLYLFRYFSIDSLGVFGILFASVFSYAILYILVLSLWKDRVFLELKAIMKQHLKLSWRL